jgi:DNA-binding response OmpR family regulator
MGCTGIRLPMADGRPLRVLVIDDDPAVRDTRRYVQTEFGYGAETAAGGGSGLVRFEDGGRDVVVTDPAMPKMNGWEVIEAIRSRAPTTAIVPVTEVSDADTKRRASEWQVPVVPKLFPLAMLRAAVVEALQLKRSQSPSATLGRCWKYYDPVAELAYSIQPSIR